MIVKYNSLKTRGLYWELYEPNELHLKITSAYGDDETPRLMKFWDKSLRLSFKVGKKRILVKGRILVEETDTASMGRMFHWKFIPTDSQLDKMKKVMEEMKTRQISF